MNLTPRYHIVPTLPKVHSISGDTGTRRIGHFYFKVLEPKAPSPDSLYRRQARWRGLHIRRRANNLSNGGVGFFPSLRGKVSALYDNTV